MLLFWAQNIPSNSLSFMGYFIFRGKPGINFVNIIGNYLSKSLLGYVPIFPFPGTSSNLYVPIFPFSGTRQ